MIKLRATLFTALGFYGAILVVDLAGAQVALPAAKPPDGAALFKQQCATCHTTNLSDPLRQGPPLIENSAVKPARSKASIIRRASHRLISFGWKKARCVATNPRAFIPSARDLSASETETRAAIIAYIKDLN